MKRIIIPFIIVITTHYALGQKSEIDTQVWLPFVKALEEKNVDAFIAVHANNVVRAEQDTKRIQTREQYYKDMLTSWPQWKMQIEKEKIHHTFELRFLNRLEGSAEALHVGYFANHYTYADGKKQSWYGMFHVLLRKTNGIWKIEFDTDTNLNNSITEEQFLKAEPLIKN